MDVQIFLTGPEGCGKTTFVQQLRSIYEAREVVWPAARLIKISPTTGKEMFTIPLKGGRVVNRPAAKEWVRSQVGISRQGERLLRKWENSAVSEYDPIPSLEDAAEEAVISAAAAAAKASAGGGQRSPTTKSPTRNNGRAASSPADGNEPRSPDDAYRTLHGVVDDDNTNNNANHATLLNAALASPSAAIGGGDGSATAPSGGGRGILAGMISTTASAVIDPATITIRQESSAAAHIGGGGGGGATTIASPACSHSPFDTSNDNESRRKKTTTTEITIALCHHSDGSSGNNNNPSSQRGGGAISSPTTENKNNAAFAAQQQLASKPVNPQFSPSAVTGTINMPVVTSLQRNNNTDSTHRAGKSGNTNTFAMVDHTADGADFISPPPPTAGEMGGEEIEVDGDGNALLTRKDIMRAKEKEKAAAAAADKDKKKGAVGAGSGERGGGNKKKMFSYVDKSVDRIFKILPDDDDDFRQCSFEIVEIGGRMLSVVPKFLSKLNVVGKQIPEDGDDEENKSSDDDESSDPEGLFIFMIDLTNPSQLPTAAVELSYIRQTFLRQSKTSRRRWCIIANKSMSLLAAGAPPLSHGRTAGGSILSAGGVDAAEVGHIRQRVRQLLQLPDHPDFSSEEEDDDSVDTSSSDEDNGDGNQRDAPAASSSNNNNKSCSAVASPSISFKRSGGSDRKGKYSAQGGGGKLASSVSPHYAHQQQQTLRSAKPTIVVSADGMMQRPAVIEDLMPPIFIIDTWTGSGFGDVIAWLEDR